MNFPYLSVTPYYRIDFPPDRLPSLFILDP